MQPGTPTENRALEDLYRSGSAVRAAGLTAQDSEPVYRAYVDFVRSFAPSGRVADIGCGAGWSTHWFASHGYDATGVDLNPAAFEPTPHQRLRFVAASGTELPFADGEFDAASAYQCLEHVPDPGRMLREMIRVVRPGGVVCVVGPNLIGIGPVVAALARHVWRHRPWWRAFVRAPGMPRHPFGNTLPEVVAAGFRNAYLIARKTASPAPTFTMREPDLTPPFAADNDSVYLCNPLDLDRFFTGQGCVVLRSTAPGRSGWKRTLAGGTWVAAQTPGPIRPVSG